MNKPIEETREIGAINAALMVVRKLVETDPKNDAEIARGIETRARHCQVVARRAKLKPLQSHRIALAAWLSALEDKMDIARQLAAQHGLDEVLFPTGEVAEGLKTEAHILAMVRSYEVLKKQYPEAATDPAEAARCLEKVLPADKEQKRLLRLFVKVLEDEQFLDGGRSGTGRILIVDPEEAVSPVLSPPLISDGYDVRVVPTVEAAREALTEFKPHLVMAEMAMQVEDGMAFCKAFKTESTMVDIPFIMLTSSKGQKTIASCLKAGADEVLTRPVDLEMLFLRIGRMITVTDEDADEASGGVSGSLNEMGLTDIIQIVTAGGRTMEIVLEQDGQAAVVCIENGEIVHAKVGDVEGEVAFYRLMRWEEGTFVTRVRESFDAHTIQGTVMGLLMEGARRDDEGLRADGSE